MRGAEPFRRSASRRESAHDQRGTSAARPRFRRAAADRKLPRREPGARPSGCIGMEAISLVAPWKRIAAASPGSVSAPVALVHGLLCSSALWTADVFREALDGVEAVALPLPGHHPWDLPPAAVSGAMCGDGAARAHAAALEAAFGGRPARLIGHSTGGLLALDVARLRPDLVSDVVLFGAIGDGRRGRRRDRLAGLIARPRIGPVAARALLRLWLAGEAGFDLGVRSVLGRRGAGRMPRGVREDLRRSDPEALRRCALAVLARSVIEECRAVRAPVLMVVGAEDPVSPAAHQLRLLRALPRAHAVVLDAGHLPVLETPAAFAAALRSWGRRADASRA